MPLPDSDASSRCCRTDRRSGSSTPSTQVEPATYIEARYRVTGDEAFLAGHFPGNPVFPGVIQLEALAQAGAIALLGDERYAGKLPLFGGVEKVRFRRLVRPGDELVLVVEIERLSARGGWGAGDAPPSTARRLRGPDVLCSRGAPRGLIGESGILSRRGRGARRSLPIPARRLLDHRPAGPRR